MATHFGIPPFYGHAWATQPRSQFDHPFWEAVRWNGQATQVGPDRSMFTHILIGVSFWTTSLLVNQVQYTSIYIFCHTPNSYHLVIASYMLDRGSHLTWSLQLEPQFPALNLSLNMGTVPRFGSPQEHPSGMLSLVHPMLGIDYGHLAAWQRWLLILMAYVNLTIEISHSWGWI